MDSGRDTCSDQVKGFKGAKYKSFKSMAEAADYLQEGPCAKEAQIASMILGLKEGTKGRVESPDVCNFVSIFLI